MRALATERLHWAYEPGRPVLDGLDFVVDEGEVIGLLGRNGAGKTTLLHLALGLLRPLAGGIRVFGLDPRRDPQAVRRRVGFVAENQVLPGGSSLGSLIALHRELFPDWDRRLELSLRERFGLSRDDRIKDLSKGQARQAALLLAVCRRPELLLLDEPASGLDPAARRGFLETSIELLNESGTTIVFSSHHIEDVERLAGRVSLLHRGGLLLDDGLDEIRAGHCLALLPADDEPARQRLADWSRCLRVRRRDDGLHAVLALPPAEASRALAAELDLGTVQCRPLGLEDLFVELAGGES